MKNALTTCVVFLAGVPAAVNSVAAELMGVLKRIGFGSAQYTYAREALPVNGRMPVVADVSKLRLDSPQVRAEEPQLMQDAIPDDSEGARLDPAVGTPRDDRLMVCAGQ